MVTFSDRFLDLRWRTGYEIVQIPTVFAIVSGFCCASFLRLYVYIEFVVENPYFSAIMGPDLDENCSVDDIFTRLNSNGLQDFMVCIIYKKVCFNS